MKRAQVSAFMIIGIFILAIIVFLLMLSRQAQTNDITSGNSDPVSAYVDSCLDNTARQGLMTLGIHGGTLKSQNTVDAGFANVTIQQQIDKEEFKQELSVYINTTMPGCLGDFSALKGYQIEDQGIRSITVSLNSEGTTVTIDMPLDITHNSRKSVQNIFTSTQNIRADYLIDTANAALSQEHYNMDFLQASGLNTTVLSFSHAQVLILEDTRFSPYYLAVGTLA